MPIRILSIDGGGIRGIIPAMALSEIEKRTGKQVWELFDLIAGTSTGGILALGLTRPGENGKARYSAADLIRLYEEKGSTIFSSNTWHRIKSLGGLLDEKYPSKGIEEVLHRYFGSTMLSECLTPVLITGYEIERRDPFFFRSVRAKENEGYNYFMREVARSTAAAPTFFEPARVRSVEQAIYEERHSYYALIDGGVFANNPAMCAFAEAKSNPRMNPRKLDDFVVLSLGTGQLTRKIPYDKAKGWGLAEWAVPLLNVVFDGVSDTIDYQLRQLLTQDRYFRLQASLEILGKDDLDDASEENLRELKTLANQLIQENKEALDRICGQLIT